MITITHVSKRYRHEQVLNDISVQFEAGHVVGLVGPNGCGKTTLMRCICGFTRPTSGQISVHGAMIGKDVDFPKNVGIIIEAPGFLPQYSGLRNLMILADISGRADKRRAMEAMRQVGLEPDSRKPVGKYSLGMRQRLGIAQAIMEDPDILLLDEPFNGLDRNAMEAMGRLFQTLKAQGKLLLLISHYAHEIASNCDILYEMRNGALERVGEEASPL